MVEEGKFSKEWFKKLAKLKEDELEQQAKSQVRKEELEERVSDVKHIIKQKYIYLTVGLIKEEYKKTVMEIMELKDQLHELEKELKKVQ